MAVLSKKRLLSSALIAALLSIAFYLLTPTTAYALSWGTITSESDYLTKVTETNQGYEYVYLDDSIMVGDSNVDITFKGSNFYLEDVRNNGSCYCADAESTGTYAYAIRAKSSISAGDERSYTDTITITVEDAGYTSNGTYVDAVITISEIYVRSYTDSASTPCIVHFMKDVGVFEEFSIDSLASGLSLRVKVDVTFYETGTNQTKTIDAKLVLRVTDLDIQDNEARLEYGYGYGSEEAYAEEFSESFWFVSGFNETIYLQEGGEVTYELKEDTYSGSYYYRARGVEGSSDNATLKSGFMTTVGGSFTFLWKGNGCGTRISLLGGGIPIITPPDNEKEVNGSTTTTAELGDTVTFTITQFIPYTIGDKKYSIYPNTSDNYEVAGNTYTRIEFTDELDSALSYVDGSMVITREDVLTGETSTVTNQWLDTSNSSKVTFRMGNTRLAEAGGYYTFTFQATIDADADLSSYTTSGSYYVIPNTATVLFNYGDITIDTNTVTIKIPATSTTTETTVETKVTYRERIISVSSSDNSVSYTFSNSSDAEKIYKEGITEYPYSHTTAGGSTTESWTVSAVIVLVSETVVTTTETTTTENTVTGETIESSSTSSDEYSYDIVSRETVTRTFNYETKTPTITQAKFTPLNLNRNGYAQTGDGGLNSTYVTGAVGKIDASVNNYENITDNSAISTLDINNDNEFYFYFNNDTFGMPSNYNWANTVATLANGTWEYVTGSSYANGYNDNADSDGYLRYNLKFYASISNNTYNSNYQTASLIINGEENLANVLISKTYTSGMSGYRLGSMSARFTFIGTYTTDNNYTSTTFPTWWITTYTQSRFYEYGSSWSGYIRCESGDLTTSSISSGSGIQDPTVYYGSYSKNSTAKSGEDTITINANNNQRGLYVSIYTLNFEQPIFYAHWDVATIAGAFRLAS